MEIKIINSKQCFGKIKIKYEAYFGVGYAVWGDTVIPKNNTYDVEIEINTVLRDKNIDLTKQEVYKIYSKSNSTIIICFLEEIEEDNVATFRLGNSIFLSEINTIAIPNGRFVKITIPNDKIVLYPVL